MFGGAAFSRGRATARGRAAPVAASVVALALLVGCATPAAESEESLATVVLERDRAAAALLEEDIDRAARYLRERWGPVILPEESIVRWVPRREWGGVMARCLDDEGLAGAQPAESGEGIDFSGVTAEGPRELYLADVAVFTCQSRYPVRSWYDAEVADIEAPWAWEYTVRVLVPCLRAAGHRPPPLPAESAFLEAWGRGVVWDPYASLAGDPWLAHRARAACPTPEVILDVAP